MNRCVYYRRPHCESKARCAFKILELDGKISCTLAGELGEVEKSSEYFKAVK